MKEKWLKILPKERLTELVFAKNDTNFQIFPVRVKTIAGISAKINNMGKFLKTYFIVFLKYFINSPVCINIEIDKSKFL
ncbi:MAG: hypothetical protein R3Y18_04565 [Bacillota bacterium]